MARKRKEDEYKSYNSGGVGYSEKALAALNRGTYGKEYGRQAQYNRSEEQVQQSKKLPVLEGLSRSPSFDASRSYSQSGRTSPIIDTDRARRKYAERIDYKPIGRSLDENDANTLYKLFDKNRLSSGGNSAIVHQLKNNMWINTSDWEKKYGKSLEQIVDDYSKDFEKKAERKNKEKGKENKISTTLGNIFKGGTVESALDLESDILGKIAPNSELTKAVRNATEKYSKQKEQTKEGVTGSLPGWAKEGYELGTNMAEKAVRYANPSKLKYLLTLGKTSEDTRQSLKKRGIEGTGAEVQSGLAGLTDAALDMLGFESIPVLKGLTESGNLGKEILGRTIIGGGEQGLTELINRGSDRLLNGDKSLHNVAVQNYISKGMSAKEAENQANKDEALALAEATVSGGILNNVVGLGGKMLGNLPMLKKGTGASVSKEANQYTDDLTLAKHQADNGLFGVKHMDDIAENDVKSILDKRGKLTEIINENPHIKRTIDGTTKAPEVLDTELNSLRSQIDNYARGGMKANAMFDCGETPAVLKESGVIGNKIMASQNVYDKITMPEGFIKNKTPQKEKVHFHGLGKDGFEKIVKGLNDPVVTLKTVHEGKDSVVAVINYTSDGGTPVLAAVTLGKDGSISNISDIDSSARLTTGHIRGNLDSYLKDRAKDIKYIKGDDNSASIGFGTTELESSSPSGNNIPPAGENVNRNDAPIVENVIANDGERVRSFSNRGAADETLPDEIRSTLSEDYYKIVRNKDVEAKADSLFVPDDLIQTRSNLDRAIEAHDPSSALLSYKLAKAYVDNGDYDAATDVLQNVSAELTRMGQFTQAAKLAMLQNDPMAAMRSYMRDIEKLNQWGSKKYKNKWQNLELSEDDINLINSIEKGDSEGLNAAFDALNEKFSKQIPATMWDKVVSASKTAMLLNLRTQSRNILANMASLPLRSASDRVSALGQNIAHLINDDVKVTQSLAGGSKAQKDIAGQIFDRLKDDITGENKMKDSVKSDILSQRQIFKDDFLAKWIDNLTGGGIQKLNQKFGANGNQSTMETLANLTYWLMGDVGDTPFVKKNFVNRLASYMKAQGINNIDDVPDEAIAIATQEALKATFKDDNRFTKALQGIKQKSGKFGEVALPFVKTPANLTMRAIDYSPAGLINTFRKIKSGADASAVIDDLSKNLTGTAMIYLGYKLAENGLLSGSYSSDPDEAEFQKQQGMLENAIHVGDNYYTYDWTQPASTPLLLGQTIYEAVKASDNENASIEDIVNATYKGGMKVANTIINSSPLQSLSDLLGDSQYGDEGVAENFANEIMEFPQRLIPSVVGATARVIDPTIRDTYIKDNSLTGTLGNQARQAVAKVPFLSKTLPASYDTWGNERTRSDSNGEAFFAQMVNPGQLGNKNETPLDAEIQRLFETTGNKVVFPLKADRSYNLGNDGTITLTNKQHSDYQKTMGQRSYSYAESLMNNSSYNKLSDDDKAALLEKAYKLSNALTKEEMFNHVTDNDKSLKEIARKGNSKEVAQYLIDSLFKKEKEDAKAAQNEAIKSATNLSASSNAAKMIKADMDAGNTQAAEQKIDEAAQLNNLGFTKPNPTETYYKAKNLVPSLTVDEFAKTYKAIDADGNQGIKQDELISYFNKNHFTSEDEAMKVWSIYAPKGKKVPYLKKDGTWGKH